jgi:hypothetical protein
MSWTDLFDRADSYEVTVDEIVTTLRTRRDDE